MSIQRKVQHYFFTNSQNMQLKPNATPFNFLSAGTCPEIFSPQSYKFLTQWNQLISNAGLSILKLDTVCLHYYCLIISQQYLPLIFCNISLMIFSVELVAKCLENGLKMDVIPLCLICQPRVTAVRATVIYNIFIKWELNWKYDLDVHS